MAGRMTSRTQRVAQLSALLSLCQRRAYFVNRPARDELGQQSVAHENRIGELQIGRHAAADARCTKSQRQKDAVTFLVHLFDFDPELFPGLVHPAPELSKPVVAAVYRVEVRPNAGGMELDV